MSVSFQWKNADFLLKNANSLLKNVDFYNKTATKEELVAVDNKVTGAFAVFCHFLLFSAVFTYRFLLFFVLKMMNLTVLKEELAAMGAEEQTRQFLYKNEDFPLENEDSSLANEDPSLENEDSCDRMGPTHRRP